LYGFTFNKPINLVDIDGRSVVPDPEYGFRGRPQVTCGDLVKRQNDYMDSIVRRRSGGKDPDCSGESGCNLITVLLDLGNPCAGISELDFGHVGVAVGDRFYDQGSWTKNGHWSTKSLDDGKLGRPFDENFKNEVKNNMSNGAGILEVTYCGCAKTSRRIVERMNMSALFESCASCASAAVVSKIEQTHLPSVFGFAVAIGYYDFKSNCGKNNNQKAKIKVFSRARE
jgi:hypothetical protein